MSRTLTSTYGGLVTLSAAGDNPVTIATGALLQDALYGESGVAWAIVNYGVVNATASNAAITLHSGGTVSNVGTGTISAAVGVYFQPGGAGTVINAGSIIGTAGNGVTLAAGGAVTNLAGGTISGSTHGIAITGAAGTITNAGSITGSGTTGTAVALAAGFANRLIIDPGAAFTGTVSGGNTLGAATSSTLELASAATAGTLTSLSTRYINFAQVSVDTGAYWVFGGADTVAAKATLTNSGTIKNAVTALMGAAVTNAAGATITSTGIGLNGLNAGSGTLNVVNAGLITSSNGSSWGVSINNIGSVTNQSGGIISAAKNAVWLGASGTLINAGSVSGAAGGEAVHVYGHLTNQSTGTITGPWAVEAAYNSPTPGTIVNAGLISGATYGIVAFSGGAVVTNQAGGVIEGAFGITMNALHPMTVVNAGTISGSSAAVILSVGGSRVIVDPGAVFIGSVNGGNSGNTLELASGLSAGTLTSLSSRYVNFPHVVVDTGASWTFVSTDTVLSGITLNNNGTLTGPVTISSGARLTNAAGGTISNVGTAIVARNAGAATIANAGSISASTEAVLFAAGGANRLILYPGAGFTGTVDGGNTIGATASSTLELASNASTGTLSSLSSRYIHFAQVTIDAGATWSFDSTDTVIAGGTLANSGTLGTGVTLGAAALLTNAATGLVTASSGAGAVYGVSGGAATVVNSGSIRDSNATRSGGVFLKHGGSVTNQSAGSISGYSGIYVTNTAGAVVNAGKVSATATHGIGIDLESGGSVTNQSGGTVTGYRGVYASLAAATVVNTGSIGGGTSAGSVGILLSSGGNVTNQAGGTISGVSGVLIGATAGTVVNAGSISASGTAVSFHAGATNRLVMDPGAGITGTVDGGNTLGATATSTLELASAASAGTLSGLGSHYVNFAQTTLDAGARWTLTGSSNTLASGSSFTNLGTLTLLNATLTDDGVITNDGVLVIDPSSMTLSSLIGTGTVTIAANSTLDITGTVGAGETIDLVTTSGAFYLTPGTGGANFAGVIDGFATGNTIGLNGIADATAAAIVNGNTLAITTGSEGTIDLTLNPSQSFSGATFNVATSGGNGIITANDLPCFMAGTRIDTPSGPVAVEHLRAGDLVCTASGGTRPVRWVGHRHLDLARHPAPRRAQPIRILADAIADGMPRRDLMISPDHALLLDGVLIAARQLCNGATIRQLPVASVTYFHVELDRHDVVMAEGLAAESYLDTGNRHMFENAGLPMALHPRFASNSQARRAAQSCAPFVDDAARVEPVWRRLAQRAVALGHTLPAVAPTTDDPALHLLGDGRRIRPAAVHDGRYVFLLPTMPADLRLASRHTAPCEARPWVEDRRRLGVMVREIALIGDTETLVIPMDHPGLDQGWWATERHAGAPVRWTDGQARLPLPAGQFVRLEVVLAGILPYPLGQESALATKAA